MTNIFCNRTLELVSRSENPGHSRQPSVISEQAVARTHFLLLMLKSGVSLPVVTECFISGEQIQWYDMAVTFKKKCLYKEIRLADTVAE